jgi:DNA-binding transcriptional LysR family regulator
MSDYLNAVRLLIRIARTRSLTAAGREMGLPQSSVSRALKGLEKRIGTALVVRTTRGVSMTDAGADFARRMELLLGEMEEAEHEAREFSELNGSLRVSLVSSLAVRWLMPRLAAFRKRHPLLRLDFVIVDYRQQLAAEGIDVTLRIGAPGDQTPLIRFIRSWPRVVVAAPQYLRNVAMPQLPADLRRHQIIAGPVGLSGGWTFSRHGTTQTIPLQSTLSISSSEAAVAAAVSGTGIHRCPEGACSDELRDGRLVRLLPDWDAGSVDLNALFGIGSAARPAARAFVEYVAEVLRDDAH